MVHAHGPRKQILSHKHEHSVILPLVERLIAGKKPSEEDLRAAVVDGLEVYSLVVIEGIVHFTAVCMHAQVT